MDHFKEMLHAERDADFQAALATFKKLAGSKLRQYLSDNWLHCKEVLALNDRALVTTLREHSTNRVESLNKVM